MKPTKEQIEAALNYLSDTESKSMLKKLDECATGIFECVLTERYCAAADILAAAYRDLLNRPHEIICTKCGLREERGEKPSADF
jgi:hypothetical protein